MLPNRLRFKQLVLWNLRGNFAVAALDWINIPKYLQLRREWKDCECKEREICLIIGGGRSFTDELAEAIARSGWCFDIFGVNYYSNSTHSKVIIPSHYVLSDPNTMKLAGAAVLKKYIIEHNIQVFMPYGVKWGTEFKNTRFFNDQENVYSNNIDPRFPRGYTSNTAFKAIAIALRLGYEKIFLFGMDHDYPRELKVLEDCRLVSREHHHYDDSNSINDLSIEYDSVAHALHCYALNFWHLRKLRSDRIVNVTDTSLIDSFNRMSPRVFMKLIS